MFIQLFSMGKVNKIEYIGSVENMANIFENNSMKCKNV